MPLRPKPKPSTERPKPGIPISLTDPLRHHEAAAQLRLDVAETASAENSFKRPGITAWDKICECSKAIL